MNVNPVSNKQLIKAVLENYQNESDKKDVKEYQEKKANEALTFLGESVIGVQARRILSSSLYVLFFFRNASTRYSVNL